MENNQTAIQEISHIINKTNNGADFSLKLDDAKDETDTTNTELDAEGNPIVVNEPAKPNPAKELLDKITNKGATTTPAETIENKNETTGAVGYFINKYGLDTDEHKELFKDLDLKSNDADEIEKFFEIRENHIVKDAALTELFENYPDALDLVQHLSNGMSLDSWKQQKVESTDWSKVTINQDQIEEQEQLLTYYYKQKGINDKKAKALIEDAKDSNELFTDTTEALKELDTLEKTRVQQIQAKEQQANQVRKKEQEAIISNINTIVKAGKLVNLTLSDKDKTELADFVLSDKREKAYTSLDLEHKLFIDNIIRTLANGTFKNLKFGAVANKAPVITVKTANPLKNISSDGESITRNLSLSEFMNLTKKQA